MVSVQHAFNIPANGAEGESWLSSLAGQLAPADLDLLARAWRFCQPLYGDRLLPTGARVAEQALGMASILAQLHMDAETLAAALLHAAPAYLEAAAETITEAFGASIYGLIDGYTRMSQIQEEGELTTGGGKRNREAGQQAEAFRQMLLAMVEDIRVVLIKLAERIQTLRSLGKVDGEMRRRISTEAMEIFAPLANRLGIWQMKWELEDLSFRYLEPDRYKKIARLLDEKRLDREGFIQEVVAQLQQLTASEGIKAEVTGRPKHIMSILRKMTRKHKTFEQIYDVRAVRVLVQDVKDCYTVLGLIHQIWQPIPGEFDDYIAHPKSNNYKALHTAVIGPEDKALEVQICTYDMYHHNEFGVAAHWRYKEGTPADRRVDEKIAWLRQIIQWKDEVSDSNDLMEQFKVELFQDRVYVLTPQGRVIDLPKGATPIDFAYAVHSNLGHRTKGALVDGAIVNLNYQLQNGQRVEILTSKQGAPSRDWLNPALGYIKTSRARAKVRQYFKQLHYDAHVAQGRTMLDKELHRLNASHFNLEKLAHEFDFHKLDDFLAAIGNNELSLTQVAGVMQEETGVEAQVTPLPVVARKPAEQQSGEVLIAGEGDLLSAIAGCCKPVPPDEIVGYITRGRGATIHRRDCTNIARLSERWGEKIIPAAWGKHHELSRFAVDLEIEGFARDGLIRDIQEILTRERVTVTAMATHTRSERTRIRYTVEVSGQEQLNKLIGLLRDIKGISRVARKI